MKIADMQNTVSQVMPPYQQGDMLKQEGGKQSTVEADKKKTVDLSGKGKEVQQFKNYIDELPDVREDKVLEIKSKLQRGTYYVSGEKIAEKMVGESVLDIMS